MHDIQMIRIFCILVLNHCALDLCQVKWQSKSMSPSLLTVLLAYLAIVMLIRQAAECQLRLRFTMDYAIALMTFRSGTRIESLSTSLAPAWIRLHSFRSFSLP